MKTILTYYKNSNSGDLITKQEFTDTQITNIPIYYYRNNKRIYLPDLTGYVKISEKHYNKLTKK